MPKFLDINVARVRYMMDLLGLSENDLLGQINKKRKSPITSEHIFYGRVKTSILKQVDEILGKKGLSFYTNPEEPDRSKQASIFFRMQEFNAKPNLGDRLIIHDMEQRIEYLASLNALADFSVERELPKYRHQDEPAEVARAVMERVLPSSRESEDRDFLKEFIGRLANANVFVFEFVETWNKKNKTSLDGFYIGPNNIVLKRNQRAFKREIFTLAHELGHHLLDMEQIDANVCSDQNAGKNIERWCNSFAFALLAGEAEPPDFGENITINSRKIRDFSDKYRVSRLAIFYNLATSEKISWGAYHALKQKLKEEYDENEQKRELAKEQAKSLGIKKKGGASPKPIISPLETQMFSIAYSEGVVDEYDVLKHFKGKKIERIIYG